MAAARLTRADFARIKAGESRRFHGRYVTLSVTTRADSPSTEPKFACIVSKKTAARAVDRNLIKRRVREAVGTLLKGSSAPVSLVFYAKKQALNASFSEITFDIQALIAQVE